MELWPYRNHHTHALFVSQTSPEVRNDVEHLAPQCASLHGLRRIPDDNTDMTHPIEVADRICVPLWNHIITCECVLARVPTPPGVPGKGAFIGAPVAKRQ